MKKSHIYYMVAASLAASLAAGCGSGTQPQEAETGYVGDGDVYEQPARINPVMSLYESDSSYMIYRNSEKIATFSLAEGRVPIKMCSQNGDSFILVSESRDGSSTHAASVPDTVDTSETADTIVSADFAITAVGAKVSGGFNTPAEIFKNGRRVMSFDSRLRALDFEMCDGHFFVLGRFGDSVYTVFRDGQRIITFPVTNESKPVDMCVFQQAVYVAMQQGNTVNIFRDSQQYLSVPGIGRCIQVSLRGLYTLVVDSLFLDRVMIMDRAVFHLADREMQAIPTMIATSDKNVIAGGYAVCDQKHRYASFYVDQEAFNTIKPDDQPLGTSDLNTKCCAVAMSDETPYYVVVKLTADMKQVKPYSYVYYQDHHEIFTLNFEESEPKLLMIASD